MARKDPEVAKTEAERNKRELERLLGEIKEKTDRVPSSVINGSHDIAVRFKAVAWRGFNLWHSRRPTLKAAQECASELARF